jgi:hypothetical protein
MFTVKSSLGKPWRMLLAALARKDSILLEALKSLPNLLGLLMPKPPKPWFMTMLGSIIPSMVVLNFLLVR